MSIEHLVEWIGQYGYAGLYGLLAISILGPPFPDELLMTFVGFLTHTGELKVPWAILSAASGSITGITLTYWIGRLFHERVWPKVEKHAGVKRIEKALRWYHWNGGVLLTIGYFIPGIRHLTGYIAGMSRLSFRRFALFAYLGALLWATTFISLGRVLGNRWESLWPLIHEYMVGVGITLGVLAGIGYLTYRNRKALGHILRHSILRNLLRFWHREEQ